MIKTLTEVARNDMIDCTIVELKRHGFKILKKKKKKKKL